jgi:hypothetical protein
VAYLTNYNSALHDIYTYSGSLLLVSELPPNDAENLNNRVVQFPTGYNKGGLWNNSASIGLASPNFSGVSASHRGSNRFPSGEAYLTYRGGLQAAQAAGPAYTELFNLMNWNPNVPRYVLLSDNYLLGCRHFNVQTLGYEIQTIFVGVNNQVYYLPARLVVDLNVQAQLYDLGVDAGDFVLYKLNQPLNAEQKSALQAYALVDPRSVPSGYPGWKVAPNGFFSLLSLERTPSVVNLSPIADSFSYYVGVYGDSTYPDELGDSFKQPVAWKGDSGSPVLVVADTGETMLLSLRNGGGAISDRTFRFLEKYIYENTGERIRRGIVSGGRVPVLKNKVQQYLDEAKESNPVFMPNPGVSSYPPLISAKLVGPMQKIKDAFLHTVRMQSDTPRFICDIASPEGPILSRAGFASAQESVLGGYVHGYVYASEGVSFSYVMPLNAELFSSNLPAQHKLTPLSLEAEQGLVEVVASQRLDSALSADIDMLEGYNYSLTANTSDSELEFSVFAGDGAGLEPCPGDVSPELAIRFINRQQPDERGNFLITPQPSDCITVDSKNSTVKVNSHCAPCCRCKDYGDTSDYIKGFAATYSKLVQTYNDLVSRYNSINEAFKQRIDATCCPTSDILNSRYRVWPQANFKVQIQALAENNSSNYIRMKDMTLDVKLSLAQTESVVDPVTNITYSMSQGDPIAVVPIRDASYLYFKNINPGRYVQSSVPQEGVLSSTVNFETLPLPIVCSDGDSPTDIPPCTGYAMITAAMVMVDPTFRRIVNLRGQEITVNAELALSYNGTMPNGSPCGSIDNRPVSTVIRPVKIGPNKSSVNPCPSAAPTGLTFNAQGNLVLKLSEAVQVLPGAFVTRSIRVLNSETGEYSDGGSIDIPITSGGAEIDLGAVDAAQASYVVTVSFADLVGLLYTQCSAPDTPDNVVSIPVPPFSISVARNS